MKLRVVCLYLGLCLTTQSACRSNSAQTNLTAAVRTRDVRVGSVTLHTVSVGVRARPVRWAIHGGPGLDHTYLRPGLDRFGNSGRVVYIDLRGHGRSSPPPDAEGYAINDAADDLATLARTGAVGTAPIDLIAHDFGAAVVLSLAARHPEIVRSLVLVAPLRDAQQVNSVGLRSRQVLGDQGWNAIRSLTTPQGTLRRASDVGTLFRRLGPMWWHRPPTDATIEAMTRTMIYRAEADANFLQAAQRWRAQSLTDRVRAPVLVVSGDDDKTFLPAESRTLAELLPHGSFVSIAEAGHLPFIERPERFSEAVERFWRSIGSARTAVVDSSDEHETQGSAARR